MTIGLPGSKITPKLYVIEAIPDTNRKKICVITAQKRHILRSGFARGQYQNVRNGLLPNVSAINITNPEEENKTAEGITPSADDYPETVSLFYIDIGTVSIFQLEPVVGERYVCLIRPFGPGPISAGIDGE